ncbi:hypothetical protein GMOD_00007378 [Pyrenophora seminiperda CCB06]|uniref:Uncharacterized protein n=1 Tax=Pyrenophora seminiperda CCB06 TaxID=1302712 RepID=A0A3M7MD16_9PLEO|nr:hypothetical protein GMOD_00007378 [Pyrenophora seminiperda CCB06]
MVVHGVSVIVSAWFENVNILYIRMEPAFPGAPNYIEAKVEDPEKNIASHTIKWIFDTIQFWRSTPGHGFQYDDLFRFKW